MFDLKKQQQIIHHEHFKFTHITGGQTKMLKCDKFIIFTTAWVGGGETINLQLIY